MDTCTIIISKGENSHGFVFGLKSPISNNVRKISDNSILRRYMAIRLIISLLMNSIICALLFNSIQINNLKWCYNEERGTFVCQAIIIPSLSTFTFHQYILIIVWSHCMIGIHYFLFPLIIRSKFYEVSICQSIGPPALRFWLLWRGCTL